MTAPSQRGVSLTPMVAMLLPALLLMIGLVVDGGAQAAASSRAERLAAAAARAASDDIAAARLAGTTPNVAHAVTVAQKVIASEPGVSAEVTLMNDRVVVHTRAVVTTVLLSLVGIDQLAASGHAEAELTPDR